MCIYINVKYVSIYIYIYIYSMNIKDETKQGIILESKEKQRKSTTSSVLEVETTNNH